MIYLYFLIALSFILVYNIGKYMEQKDKDVITYRKYRSLVDDKNRNWQRISLNDFGVRYSQDFVEYKKKEKVLWKNLFSQKHMTSLKEE